MAGIRVTCESCGARPVIPAAGVLLLAEPGGTSGVYLFSCPRCERVTSRLGSALEIGLLQAAGVVAAGGAPRAGESRPDRRVEAAAPFTRDDLLAFHLLLADDGWFRRLTLQVGRPTPGRATPPPGLRP